MQELHGFCASDLSAFYFDVRKDALYCDRPDNGRRRAARTVLDLLHRCLCSWLAPVLCFTAEDAWTERFGDADSVHLQTFPDLPPAWRDDALGARMAQIRDWRGTITTAVEALRRDGTIGASLQAQVSLPGDLGLRDADGWEEIAIVSKVILGEVETVIAAPAPGEKCDRCWRVLEEVGAQPGHPALCARCADAVDSGLVCQAVAA